MSLEELVSHNDIKQYKSLCDNLVIATEWLRLFYCQIKRTKMNIIQKFVKCNMYITVMLWFLGHLLVNVAIGFVM